MPEEAIAVLLIEDNPNDARVLQEMLSQSKGTQFEVEYSDCLSVGLKRLEKGGIKVILLDLFLPESKGIETLTKIQAKALGAPIVVLSALDDELTSVKAVQKGAQDYLVKSCLTTELLTRSIRYAIERKQVEEELKQTVAKLTDFRRASIYMLGDLDKTSKKLEKANEQVRQKVEELKTVNEELENFAYVVSHDLKAPLRGISQLAHWLSVDYADKLDCEGKEQLELLLGRAKRMHDLIEGILQYSRIGRIKDEKKEVDMNKVVGEAVLMISPPENIKIEVIDKLPIINCGKTRIEQVFSNLIGNAAKYMDKPEGVIKIDCEGENDFWKFSVSDNGPGIEEKYYRKIFRIFQTLAPRDEVESTGVGLSLVKKIVELYGGKVWVESVVGQGSTFYFTLPK